MTKDKLMALADAYAAAEQHDYLTGEASADHARAALEAALTEKQEPVNQQLLEALKVSLEAMEYADACLKKQLTTKTKHEYAQDLLMGAGTAARAAIAAAEKER